MRDFRDAKAMAQTLRTSLTAKAVPISHSESLELVSKMFGVADWNTLSATIQAGRSSQVAPVEQTAETVPGRYPAIPMRDLVPFPGATYPIFVGRAKTKQALEQAFRHQREVVMAVQKNSGVDEPGTDDIYEIGVLAALLDLELLPDRTLKVLAQIYRRVTIKRFESEPPSATSPPFTGTPAIAPVPMGGGYVADVQNLSEGHILEAPNLIRTAVTRFAAYAERHSIRMPQAFQLSPDQVRAPVASAALMSTQIRDPGRVADIICTHIRLPIPDKQALLATLDPVARLQRVDYFLLADEQAG